VRVALDLQALAGLVLFIALALPFSSSIRSIRWRLVAIAVALQFAICFVLLKVPPVATALGYLNHAVSALSTATGQGTAFVFGYVGGAPPPFTRSRSSRSSSSCRPSRRYSGTGACCRS